MERISSQPRRALYTVLIGDYEKLNELEVLDSSVRAICFTDSPELMSSTWEIVMVQPMFPSDPVRSQRLIKILGHEMLDQYDEWLYIDNTVRLLQTPSAILDEFLKGCDLAIPSHCHRLNVRAEFSVVQDSCLDSFERIEEQLFHYEEHFPSSLNQRPLWTAIIARRPTALVRKWSEFWAQHVLRYSRRDQLSVLAALEVNNIHFRRIEVDNFSSDFHLWPILNERKESQRIYSRITLDPEVHYLQQENLRLSNEIQVLQKNFIDSTSWKITKPIRVLSKAIERFLRIF